MQWLHDSSKDIPFHQRRKRHRRIGILRRLACREIIAAAVGSGQQEIAYTVSRRTIAFYLHVALRQLGDGAVLDDEAARVAGDMVVVTVVLCLGLAVEHVRQIADINCLQS